MTKNLLVHLKDIERSVENSNHLMLTLDLDELWNSHPRHDFSHQKIKYNIRRLAHNPFVTTVIISAGSSDKLYKEFGLKELVYAGNYGLDILYHGPKAMKHEVSGNRRMMHDFYQEIKNLVSSFPQLQIVDNKYSVQISFDEAEGEFPECFMLSIRKVLGKYPNLYMHHSCSVLDFKPIGFFQRGSVHARIQKLLGKSNVFGLYIGNHRMSHAKAAIHGGIKAVAIGKNKQLFSDYHLDDLDDLQIFLTWLNEVDCIKYFVPAQADFQLN